MRKKKDTKETLLLSLLPNEEQGLPAVSPQRTAQASGKQGNGTRIGSVLTYSHVNLPTFMEE